MDNFDYDRGDSKHLSPPAILALSDAAVAEIIAECQQAFAVYFRQIAENFWRRLDDEVVPYFHDAESRWQERYFEFLRYMREERIRIEQTFTHEAIHEFEEFWLPVRSAAKTSLVANERPSFGLLEGDAAAENYVIANLIRNGEHILHGDLLKLERFFNNLRRRCGLDLRDNPVAPAGLCRLFVAVLERLSVDHKFRLPIYRVFDKLVLHELGVVYGVLCQVGEFYASSPADAEDSTAATARRRRISHLQAFRALRPGLTAWRFGGQTPERAGKGVFEYYEVLHALTVLQHEVRGEDLAAVSRDNGTTPLKETLLARLSLEESGERTLGGAEEDVVDLIALIFGHLYMSKEIPDSLVKQLARLQIPCAKVGILDKSFFFEALHPLRQLINAMLKAAWQAELRGDEAAVAAKTRQMVDSILAEFEVYAGVFKRHLERFSEFSERLERRCRKAEARNVQACASRERLAAAKRAAASAIVERTAGTRLPDFVRRFLDEVWRDVLVLARLKRNDEPEAWPQLLALTDRLIRSVIPPADAKEKQHLLCLLPELIAGLRTALTDICWDKHSRSRFFKELAVFHVILLNPRKSAHSLERFYRSAPDDDCGNTQALASGGGAEWDAPSERRQALFCTEAWYEIADEGETAHRVKLAWMREGGGLYLFVDGHGAMAAEKTAAELDRLVRDARVSPVDVGRPVSVDEAFGNILARFRAQSDKSGADALVGDI